MSRALPAEARAADAELRAMQAGCYVIALPLPDRELHPNARVHWRVKARHAREARSAARYAVFATYGDDSALPHYTEAHVNVHAVYGDRRRRDADGLLASCKAYIDGIVDSGLLGDDAGLTYTLPPARVDRACPGVTIEICAVKGGA